MTVAAARPIAPMLIPGFESWETHRASFFSQQCLSRFGCIDPLYSLPEDLLECIKENLPDLLTADEMAFERGFSSLCTRFHTLGSIHHRPIPLSMWQAPTRVVISRREFRELGWNAYMTYAECVSSLASCYDRMDLVRNRMEAYRGWLVTNAEYQSDVANLKTRWGEVISQIGAIPGYSVRLERSRRRVPRGGRDVSSEYESSFNDFYEKWDLSGLLTWDFPEPFGPNLAGIPYPSSISRPATTITLQVPVSLAVPSTYPMNQQLREIQGQIAQPHLRGWIDVCNQRDQSDLGFGRFRGIFQLYYFRETVLGSRYGDRFAGRIEDLDLAFGAYLGLSPDSVKRLRLQSSRLRRSSTHVGTN